MPLRFINHLQLSLPCYIDGHRLLAVTQSNYQTSSSSHKSRSDTFNSGQTKQLHTSSQSGGTQAPASLRPRNQIPKSQYKNRGDREDRVRDKDRDTDRSARQPERRRVGQGEDRKSTTSSSAFFESNTESRNTNSTRIPTSPTTPSQSQSSSVSSSSSVKSSESKLSSSSVTFNNYNITLSTSNTYTQQQVIEEDMTTQSFPEISVLLANNAQWASDVNAAHAGFFEDSAKGQSPKVLWIGCADSRVPESVITASKPGDIFVHRNVANQFNLKDDSAMAVLEYAVETVGVKHIVIAGHTHCGGVVGALSIASTSPPPPSNPSTSTPLQRYLTPLISLASKYTSLPQPEAVLSVVEENVRRQVANICATDVMRAAWEKGNDVYVHGWVYELESGKLRDLGVSKGPGL